MFASRLTTQLKRFFSWRPNPEAEALDAFNQPTGKRLCQPSLEHSGQSAATTDHTSSSGSSMEEPTMVSYTIGHFPVLFPHKKDLIIPTHPESVPATVPQLAAQLISGNASRTKKFLKKAQSCCSHHGDRSLQNHMTHYLESGLIGVINDTLIQF